MSTFPGIPHFLIPAAFFILMQVEFVHSNESKTPSDSVKTGSDSLPGDTNKTTVGNGATTPNWTLSPISILEFPFYLTGKGLEQVIYLIDRKKIVPKVRKLLVSQDESRIFLPFYSSELGAGMGIRKKGWPASKTIWTHSVTLGTYYRGSVVSEMTGFPLGNPLDNWFGDVSIDFNHLPDERFYGRGPGSSQMEETDYSHQKLLARLGIHRMIGERLKIKFFGGADWHNFSAGSVKDIPDLPEVHTPPPGYGKRAIYGVSGTGFSFHNSSPENIPREGTEIDLLLSVYNNVNNYPFHFFRSDFIAKSYYRIFKKRVLLLSSRVLIQRPWPDNQVPLSHWADIGEDGTVRGYPRGRFRDRDALYLGAEYRYPVWSFSWPVIEMVAFMDAGQTVPSLPMDLDQSKVAIGYGLGMRINSEERMVFSWSLGFHPDGFRVHVRIN